MKESVVFNHERLEVYRLAINFNAWVNSHLAKVPKYSAMNDQLERASISIPLNIAEGNGRYYPKDKCRFLDIAMGSALECAACLDVLLVKGKIPEKSIQEGKRILHQIVAMLTGLIKSHVRTRGYKKQ